MWHDIQVFVSFLVTLDKGLQIQMPKSPDKFSGKVNLLWQDPMNREANPYLVWSEWQLFSLAGTWLHVPRFSVLSAQVEKFRLVCLCL